MRIGLVAEGPSDGLLIEALVDRYWPGSEVRRIQPDFTLAAHLGGGWKGVRAWCRENGSRLDTIMSGIEGDDLDLLVIHVDCSMAHNEGAVHPCPPPSDTADALRRVIVRDWIGQSQSPPSLVLMTPSKTTDTWLFVGQGFSIPAELEPIECSFDVEDEFVRRRLLRRRGNEVKKPSGRVEPLARTTAANWDLVTAACSEARTFWSELQSAAP